MKRSLAYILAGILTAQTAAGQSEVLDLNGYLSNVQQVSFSDPDETWTIDNMFHNRMNLFVYGGQHFRGSAQLRTRLMFGNTLQIPGYVDALGRDMGLLPLTRNLMSGESYVLNTSLDRLWIRYMAGRFEATFGRQRINWGQTFVWNVNDIFNAYSYFDVDYEERPGSDALRLQFYPDYTSAAELAAKLDSTGRVTVAALYRFNVFNYDIQFIAGMLAEEDYLAGLGWSGNFGGLAFRGEGTYFHPVSHFRDTSGSFMLSAGFDYSFPNTIMLQAEYLYSSQPVSPPAGFAGFYANPLTVKQLAFTDHTFFASGSYQVTPLISATLAGMYFPEFKGAFIGPSLNYNIHNNMDASFFMQYFNGEMEDPVHGGKSREQITLLFLRLKWNF